MTGRLVLLGALALVALAAAAPASAREPSRKCYPPDARGLAAGTRARVFYEDGEDGDYFIHACDLLTGRRTLIAEGTFRDGENASSIRFAGRIVGFVRGSCTSGATVQGCSSAVYTLDVQSGRRLWAGVEGEVLDLVVSPTGAAAWIERSGSTLRVKGVSAGFEATELDSGPAVEPGSLALAAGGRLHWTNDGAPRSAPLAWRTPPREPRDPPVGGHRNCRDSPEYVYGAGRRARLFAYERDHDSVDAVVCNLRTGVRTIFAQLGDDGGIGVEQIRFEGWYMAIARRFLSRAIDYPTILEVVDVRTGRSVTTDRCCSPDEHATDLVLTREGDAAWVNGGRLRVCRPGAPCAELGAAEPGSLAHAGGRLYWTGMGGMPRSAPFH